MTTTAAEALPVENSVYDVIMRNVPPSLDLISHDTREECTCSVDSLPSSASDDLGFSEVVDEFGDFPPNPKVIIHPPSGSITTCSFDYFRSFLAQYRFEPAEKDPDLFAR